ncbi:MAG: hypothetical protein HY060_19320 [Proteobacteria bacterium]|nr:hypothetical protein [Pseudomonadota bacterium]
MRQLLLFGMPLVAPIALYLLWFVHATRVAQAAGHEPPRLGDVPWPWLVVIAVLLIVGSVSSYVMMGGEAPGGHYEAPHLLDGKIVPGHISR